MLLAVFICHSMAVGETLLKDRVNNKFLANKVTGKFPCKLVLLLGFLLISARCEDFVIVVLKLAVIIFDYIDDAG